MNDYFDQFERSVGNVLQEGAHRPWYSRRRRFGHPRAVGVVVAALVVATPAVGAVSDWFGLGAADHLAKPSAVANQGAALPGTSELLPLRVTDPQGGPRWAARQVRTTRGDSCLQVGRIENGKLGSLGIDDASGNDHLFHPFPGSSVGDICGSTDADGNGYVNVLNTALAANAVPQARSLVSCQPVLMWPASMSHGRGLPSLASIPRSKRPTCSTGSARIVAAGLLGPEAQSVKYETPEGTLRTQQTSGPNGAYLLVFSLDQHTCNLYLDSGPCGQTEVEDAASPDAAGPIKSITYRDGHTCTMNADKPCPPVGYVAPKPVSAKEVTAPLHARIYKARYWCLPKRPARTNSFAQIPCDGAIPAGYQRFNPSTGHLGPDPGVLIDVWFKAPLAVTTSSSSYAFTVGSTAVSSFNDVRKDQTLRYQGFEPDSQPGDYQAVVSYTQSSNPVNEAAGPDPAGPGSVVVGRIRFRVP